MANENVDFEELGEFWEEAVKQGKYSEQELAKFRKALNIKSNNDVIKKFEEGMIRTANVVNSYKDALENQRNAKYLKDRVEQEKEIAHQIQIAQTDIYKKIAADRKAEEEALLKLEEAAENNDKKGVRKATREANKTGRKADIKEAVAKKQESVDMTAASPLQGLLDQVKGGFKFLFTAEGKKAARDEAQKKAIKAVGAAVTAGLNAVNNAINAYADKQAAINARLQGISSYGEAAKKLGDVAFSPLLKAEDLYTNLGELVHSGISHNVEQRAFFQTVKTGIAETFDANEAYINRMIRIQQNDSTAARLGMESYLTRWLNEYVENTEYLTTTFDSVAQSLFEASAVIGARGGTGSSLEFEAVVQGWLGAMTGVGFSEQSAQSIADALGQLGSGNLAVLESDIGTLFTMAAASEGKNIGEMLVNGLDVATTNELLNAAVKFLQSINDNNNNNVTKAEMAKIFGVSVSDLISLNNLNAEALKSISTGAKLGYNEMYGELIDQFNQLPERLGISNILQNLFNNLTYQTGMSIASNPITYALWKVTDMIQGVTGGINIPAISALGTGVDLEATVENLMKLGIVGVATLGNIGKIGQGLRSIGSGSSLLEAMSIDADNARYQLKKLGSGLGSNGPRSAGDSLSGMESLVGNGSGEDLATSAQNDAENEANKKLKKKKKEAEDTDPTLSYLKKTVKLHTMLRGIYAALGGKFTDGGDIDAEDNEGLKSALAIANADALLSSEVLATVGGAYSAAVSTNLDEVQGVLVDIRDILSNAIATSSGTTTLSASNVNIIMSAATNSISTSAFNNDGAFDQRLTPVNSVAGNYNVGSGNNYLEQISFEDNFKRLVSDVEAIKNKVSGSSYNTGIQETSSIEGFSQPSYGTTSAGTYSTGGLR